MSRFAREYTVYFWGEPTCDSNEPFLAEHPCPRNGVTVLAPYLPGNLGSAAQNNAVTLLLNRFLKKKAIVKPILWYYTPMALAFSRHIPSKGSHESKDSDEEMQETLARLEHKIDTLKGRVR